MDLRHLRYFVAVAEERSFTRAAERLWIAQPGLSQQIIALERELGVRLFERLSRGVELTDAGRVFLAKAYVAINAADDALAVGRDASAGLTGTLRLGLSWRSRYDQAPELQHAFSTAYPGVDVAVVEAQTDALVRDVCDRRLDAAIVMGPQRGRPGLAVLAVGGGSVGLIMAPGHPLAALELLTAEHLEGQTFMLSGDRGATTYDDATRQAMGLIGVDGRVRAGGYGFAMLAPVRAGEAVMFDGVPSLAAGAGLVWRPVTPAPVFRYELVWLSDGASGPLKAFVERCAHPLGRMRAPDPVAR